MAPRRKKQKTNHAPAAADATVRSTTQPAIDRLPTELLQMSFEYLSFHDLIRCRHVCGKWLLRIPGNDTDLRKKLFLTTDLPPWTRELHIQAANYLSKPFGHTFAMEPNRPRIVTRDYYPERLQTNPILKIDKSRIMLTYPSFRFSSVEQLREKATSLKSRVDKGLWTDMLICVPPVQKAELRFAIFAGGFRVGFTRTLADNRGIRLQSLVDSLRSLLKEVADKLTIHKVALRYKSIIEIFDWLGNCEEGDGTFEVPERTRVMETRITKEGHMHMVWSRMG
ncbi:hypothetical protein J4E91_006362 [Alternaria rosae]|nr:hypothetical protein J4E91_006362 [Alternaria rosae]